MKKVTLTVPFLVSILTLLWYHEKCHVNSTILGVILTLLWYHEKSHVNSTILGVYINPALVP